ncbi:MAG: NifU family protein [Candidatus Carsonella ruddii]|nr:MAG: NifU family protein [Candidatus Carsonella ruddii]
MNVIKIFNYYIYITDSCYCYLFLNKKKNFFYKILIKNKGKLFSTTKIYYSLFKKNLFNKLIKIKNIFLIIDILSICFLNNSCLHYEKKIIINSPNSFLNLFIENKILSKIIFLLKIIINKKILNHNGYLKINYFNFKKKTLSLIFLGNCNSCNFTNITFNNFVLKILKKIKLLKIIKLNE